MAAEGTKPRKPPTIATQRPSLPTRPRPIQRRPGLPPIRSTRFEDLVPEALSDTTSLAKARPEGTTFQKTLAKVRRGLPYSALEALQKQASLSQGQMAALVGIPERTIGRRKKEGRLTPSESDRVERTSRIMALAVNVFGEEERAKEWLQRPSRALDGETPLSLLDTDVGVRAVEDELLRIEHGTYA